MSAQRVIIKDDATGQIHARARTGLGPLLAPVDCGVNVASYTFVNDLRAVDLSDWHKPCFKATASGTLDRQYTSEQDPDAA